MLTLFASILLPMLAPASRALAIAPDTSPGMSRQSTVSPSGHRYRWPGLVGPEKASPQTLPNAKPNALLRPGGIGPVCNSTLIQGWFVDAYTDAQWLQFFQNLAGQGVTSVVFAASVDESETSYSYLGTSAAYASPNAYAHYPVSSTVTGTAPYVTYAGNASGASRSPVEECLYYAGHNGVNNSMSVYVGLNSYPDEWGYRSGTLYNSGTNYGDPITDSGFTSSQASLGALVASDLASQFGSYTTFAGWYWPWEIDNVYFDASYSNINLPSGYASTAYVNLVNMLKTSYCPLSGKARLISPFFNP